MASLRDIKPQTKLPFVGVVLPTITITPEQQTAAGAPVGCTNLEFLTQLCRNGYEAKVRRRVPRAQHATYVERVKHEIDTIESLGFTNYMLMVWDICRHADEQGIPRGPGRGSVASSLVSSLLNITDVDPIETGLFFTRFLSKARAKTTVVDGVTYVDGGLVADIDMDFCYYRRAEIIDYVNRRYPGQTAKLLTTTTLASRVVLKELMKVYENASEDQAKEVSALIEDKNGVPVSVEDSFYGDQKWRAGDEVNGRPPNERFVTWGEQHVDVVSLALKLEGLNKSEGVHASALAICAMPIRQLIPLQLAKDDEGVQHTVTGYDMYDAQELVLKFDLLGLKTLSILNDCSKALGFDWRDIDVHHESIYAGLQNFKRRYGIFQLETWAQGTAAAKVKPRNFEQLSGVLAIARPGAIAYLQQFADYVNEDKFTSIHPLIDDILRPTGGVCVYQEQYLAMLVKVGLAPDEAENARKVLGKKLVDKVPEVLAKIREVCTRNSHPPEIADLLLKIAEDSGGYAFSSAHSTPYAKITAYTLYLKANHPLQFFWALLEMTRNESEKYEKLAVIRQEMQELGIDLLPPHFHHSEVGFKIEEREEGQPPAIRFALGMIRGVSSKNVEKLDLFRTRTREGSTKFEVFQSLKNAGLNIGIGSALIQAGCLEGYDGYVGAKGVVYHSRSRLVLELQTWNLLKDTEKAECSNVGDLPEVGWDVMRAIMHLNATARTEKGKPVIIDRRFETIKRHYAPYKAIYEQNSRNERLASYYYERRVLGYSYSETISDIFADYVDGLVTVAAAKQLKKDSVCRLIGFVADDPFKGKTAKGNARFKFTLSDETGQMSVSAFNERIDVIEEQNGRLPVAEDLVICTVKVMDEGTAFLQQGPDGVVCGIQSTAIYMKLQDLKDAKAKEAEKAEAAAAAAATPVEPLKEAA